jgi:uncharacterized protein (DUF488 family)
MPRAIATIGYEGAALDDFVAALRRAHIDTVIDVRELPLSRKKGFSKNQLAEQLRRHGIAYVHIKALGTPKKGRDAARAGNEALFKKIFADHMRTAEAKDGLQQAASLVQTRHACLMCFEADHTKCHRTIVAERLAPMTHAKVTPLIVQAASTRET